MKILIRIFSGLIFAFLFLIFLFPKTAEAKSFYFPNVAIDISIQKDSSIKVVEKRAFSFDGNFTQIYWDIPLDANQQIRDVTLTDSYYTYEEIPTVDASRPVGKFSSERNGENQHIEAYHSSSNENRQFVLSYTLTNAVTRYSDVAEFYWKVIGDAWGSRTDTVQIRVKLPEKTSKDAIYVWGHGPLNGEAKIIDGETVAFDVLNLPPETFVETRVLFPQSLITSGPFVAKDMLEEVKQEEKSFQDKTIFEQRLKTAGVLSVPLVIILWAAFWFVIWWREGREYHAGIPKYIHTPPSNLEPALVEALITQGLPSTANAFSATILDLARKKHIKIEAQQNLSKGFLGIGGGMKYKYILHKNTPKKGSLKGFEKQVLDFVFSFSADGKSVSVEEIKSGMKSQPISTRSFFKTWQETIKTEFHKLGHIEPESKKWKTRFVISNVIFLVVLGLLTAAFLHVLLYAFLHVVIFGAVWGLILFLALGNAYLRWSLASSKEAYEWLAFKHYLNDFSRFKSEIPQAVIIWQEMLVYGTVFGIAKKVAEYLPLILGQEKMLGATSSWFYITGGGGNMSESVSGMGLDFATSFSQSMSDMSKSFSSSFSSGGGGGFSGGGGGGGGGAS